MNRSRYVAVGLLVSLVGLIGCPYSAPDLNERYKAAVADAATADTSEISKNLTAITDANPSLIWRGENDSRQVLMVTWTSYTGYNDKVGQTITLSREVWVTAAPQVQEFCAFWKVMPWDLDLRLEELLGLPPNSGKTTFVQFWVSPNDLFRPSPDPEITDQEAEVGLPTSSLYVTVDQSYLQWFVILLGSSYGDNGYPWTRLGYTYDWGNPFTEVGLSEFVIRSGASVAVESVTATADYCKWW